MMTQMLWRVADWLTNTPYWTAPVHKTRLNNDTHQRATRGLMTPDDTAPGSRSSRQATHGQMDEYYARLDEQRTAGRDETRQGARSLAFLYFCVFLFASRSRIPSLSADDNTGALTCGQMAYEYTVVDDVDERVRWDEQTGHKP
jgi:hypothetical protein